MHIQPIEDTCRSAADVLAASRRVAETRKRLMAPRKPRREPIPAQEPAIISYAEWASNMIPYGSPLSPPSGLPRGISVHRIIATASKMFGVSVEDLCSARRSAGLPDMRACIYWCARELTTRSLPLIGKDIGGRDHSTVLHGVKKVSLAVKQGRPLGRRANALRDAVIERFAVVKPRLPIDASIGELFPISSVADAAEKS